jgi:prepilin-type N-terminal cleavage/methylation domain-containing protein
MHDKKGFTLIELVTAIVIIAIVSTMAGMGLIQIANGYALAKKSAVLAQQAQIALTRLSKEFAGIQSIISASGTSITYTRLNASGLLEPHSLVWTGPDRPLALDGDALIDKEQLFSLTYHNAYNASPSSYSSATAVIEMSFQLKNADGSLQTFIQRTAI